jgi:ABC-type microcin C transport system duplicated ATPase subunit YejF
MGKRRLSVAGAAGARREARVTGNPMGKQQAFVEECYLSKLGMLEFGTVKACIGININIRVPMSADSVGETGSGKSNMVMLLVTGILHVAIFFCDLSGQVFVSVPFGELAAN